MGDDNHVVIGMDPHKRSVTIEVMTSDEQVLGGGRFATDVEGFAAMLTYVAAWPDRVWAVEGCEGIGRHVAQRLLAEDQSVVDVPAKLSARVRVFATGQGRKTDDTDAHSIALVGVRMTGLRAVVDDAQLELLRLLVDRRRRLGEDTPGWSASCTSYCSNSSPVGQSVTCLLIRRAGCSLGCDRETWWTRPASST